MRELPKFRQGGRYLSTRLMNNLVDQVRENSTRLAGVTTFTSSYLGTISGAPRRARAVKSTSESGFYVQITGYAPEVDGVVYQLVGYRLSPLGERINEEAGELTIDVWNPYSIDIRLASPQLYLGSDDAETQGYYPAHTWMFPDGNNGTYSAIVLDVWATFECCKANITGFQSDEKLGYRGKLVEPLTGDEIGNTVDLFTNQRPAEYEISSCVPILYGPATVEADQKNVPVKLVPIPFDDNTEPGYRWEIDLTFIGVCDPSGGMLGSPPGEPPPTGDSNKKKSTGSGDFDPTTNVTQPTVNLGDIEL